MRKRRDRVRIPGEEKLYSSNRMLPRDTNREVEASLLYGAPRSAVYLDGISAGRKPNRVVRRPSGYFPFPFPAKHAVRRSEAMRLVSPLWRVELKRQPMRVRFCVQRKERREVLFALGRAGFSGSAPGRYRRVVSSNYGC